MKSTTIKTVTAIVAGALSTLIGGWDMILEILLIVMTLDYITGVVSAFKQKTVSSNKGYMGLVKKGGIFVIIILAASFGLPSPLIQLFRANPGSILGILYLLCIIFVANDALSVLENVGELGIELPAFLRSALIKLREVHENPPELSGHDITPQHSPEDIEDNADSLPDDKR